MTRIVEAQGEPHRYRWKREGLRYAIRAGTGTRVLFRVWRESTAIRLCTELLCAYNDGWFMRSRESEVLLQGAARMLASTRAFGYQVGTTMPVNRHIREWLARYEAATGDRAHKIFNAGGAADAPGTPQ